MNFLLQLVEEIANNTHYNLNKSLLLSQKKDLELLADKIRVDEDLAHSVRVVQLNK